MSLITRPILAVPIKNMDDLKLPCSLTDKYDGIRCLCIDGNIVSRNFKPIPNSYVRETLEDFIPDGMDGELMLKSLANSKQESSFQEASFSSAIPMLNMKSDDEDKNILDFNTIQSAIMSFDGTPDFKYCIFDYVKDSLEKPYVDRIEDLKEWYKTLNDLQKDLVELVLPETVSTLEEVEKFESEALECGYEGVIVRDPQGVYKCGRSTLNQGIMLKIKRFRNSEAKVIGFVEQMKNTNELEKDAFGLAKRSAKKEGKVGSGMVGTILAVDINEFKGVEIKVGTGEGMTQELRKEMWENQEEYIGKILTYNYQQDPVKTELPRFPSWKGWRSKIDF
jgi:DNA ligase-1